MLPVHTLSPADAAVQDERGIVLGQLVQRVDRRRLCPHVAEENV